MYNMIPLRVFFSLVRNELLFILSITQWISSSRRTNANNGIRNLINGRLNKFYEIVM